MGVFQKYSRSPLQITSNTYKSRTVEYRHMCFFDPKFALFIEEILFAPHLGVLCCDAQDVSSADIARELTHKAIDGGIEHIVIISASCRQ